MQQNLNIKKQGLHLLIENYLKRRGPEDIYFMQKHIKTTENLAASINSDLELGLSQSNILENQELYGSNSKKVTEDHKLQEFSKIIRSQLLRFKCLFLLITIILEYICGTIWHNPQLRKSSIFILVLICLSLILKISLRWRSFSIISKDNFGKKPSKVYVYREGEKFQITQNLIKVGDVIFIDFNEIIPVSGVLISPHEITVDEELIDRGIQKKLNLEQCLKQIENKSELQLKIDFQNAALPSPILIQGSKPVQGGTFKLLVIATGQSLMLSSYGKAKNESLSEKSILQEWINTISKDLQHISEICFIIIFIFHTIAMVFKVLGLPPEHYEDLLHHIVDALHILIVISFLLDTNTLIELLKGEYLSALTVVSRGSELDRLLSVEQILISDENICKYDEINPKKIFLCDMHEPVEIKLLPAMQDTINYSILYEIMGGVELDDALPQRIHNKFHKNALIHVNNSQQRIFSSLYQHCYSSANAPLLQQNESESLGELFKHNKHIHELQTQKINRVIPDPSSQSVAQSISNDCSLHVNTETEKIKLTDKAVRLDDYLGKHCQFSTQNIIEGLNKLAKNSSRTYYFQKFSVERLSKVKNIWNHCRFSPIKEQDRQQLLLGIKKLERQNLTVYLLGIDEGAFSNQYMSFLFGAIGVQVSQQSKIIEKLKNLERIGINSLITIFKNNFEEMNELQRHQYEYDFLKRGWMNQNDHFCKLETIKNVGGRKLCRICLLNSCSCRPKAQELSNIQGFLQAIEEVKCIYNLTEEDIEYIELGFEQLNTTTLRIVDRKQDTIGKLSQIIVGHQLMNILQENLSLWILLLLLTFFYYFPINYITFGNVFCNEQLYFYFIYVQLLLSRHNFMKNSQEVIHQQKGIKSRRKKNMFGWAIKGDILIFVLLVMASSIFLFYFPKIFIQDNLTAQFAHQTCFNPKSFYHNPDIKVYVCKHGDETFVLYPKLQTFIFLVTLLAITFKTFFSTQKVVTLINIAFHLTLIGILLIFVYLCPSFIHLSKHGLSIIELSLAFSLALAIVFLSTLNRWIIASLQGGKRFQLNLDLSASKRYNEYAQILKEYKQLKTLKYTYEQQ